MCSNQLKHGGGGELLARTLQRDEQRGLELLALDKGPGMHDVAKCLRDGFSTSGSPGTGLGAIERLSQQFDVYSQPERGTAVMSQIWLGARSQRSPVEIGAIVIPKAGETACGDAWCHTERVGGVLVMGVDGLGHGPAAARAAHDACQVFEAEKYKTPALIMSKVHDGLRASRGAAVTVIDVDWLQGRANAASIGNVLATIVDDQRTRHVVSDNGIVGHAVPRIREMSYECPPHALVILHSDGIASWHHDRYPGLMQHHCALIAGVLYRDYNRGRDDALVVVLRRGQQ
jgi:Stage II sporulation protein E (SpoIIE)